MRKIRVWDLPTRLFHWGLAVLLIVSVVTQGMGGNAMEWHFRSGYAVLVLIAFRILWGLVGTHYARFSSFLYGPSAMLGYLRGKDAGTPGHNPLGSLSVFLLLGAFLAQAVSGLYANDDIAYDGPLVKFIGKELSDKITWFHKDVSATAIYVLVGLHVLAILYYRLARKRNLMRPMLTGDQEVEFDAVAANDSWPMRAFALGLLLLCAAAVYFVVTLPGPAPLQ